MVSLVPCQLEEGEGRAPGQPKPTPAHLADLFLSLVAYRCTAVLKNLQAHVLIVSTVRISRSVQEG